MILESEAGIQLPEAFRCGTNLQHFAQILINSFDRNSETIDHID